MKLDELAKEYGLLIDEEGRYYRINEQGKRKEPWISIYTFSESTGISDSRIQTRVISCETRPIKNNRLRIVTGYNLNDLLQCCAGLLNTNHPIANKQGWLVVKRKKFATLMVLATKLGIAKMTIKLL